MSDYSFDLKPATKKSIPPLVGLWGKSGSGKTYSALLLARGLVGPKGKIAFIDTENRRAEFYADVAGGWLHLNLEPPFGPEKYDAAFKFCESKGVDVIIVDSMSHVWEGTGGVLDKAEQIGGVGLHKWKAPKIALKRMTNNLMRSALPVIFCIRSKDGVKQVGKGKDAEIVHTGPTPIAEKNFVYEMTVDLHMTKNGHYDLETSKTVPQGLRNIIVKDGIVNEAMGAAIAGYCGSGDALDTDYLKLKRDGQDAAMSGKDAYIKWKDALTQPQRDKIKNHHSEWAALAMEMEQGKEPGGEVRV